MSSPLRGPLATTTGAAAQVSPAIQRSPTGDRRELISSLAAAKAMADANTAIAHRPNLTILKPFLFKNTATSSCYLPLF